jgi:hypothetical protein
VVHCDLTKQRSPVEELNVEQGVSALAHQGRVQASQALADPPPVSILGGLGGRRGWVEVAGPCLAAAALGSQTPDALHPSILVSNQLNPLYLILFHCWRMME